MKVLSIVKNTLMVGGGLFMLATCAAIVTPSEPSSSTSLPDRSEAAPSSSSSLRIGDRATSRGGRAVTVTGVQRLDVLSIENMFAEDIAGPIARVDAVIENTSSETGNMVFANFKLVDAQGREYDQIQDFELGVWQQEQGIKPLFEDMYPGESRPSSLIFRVAPDATGLQLKWSGNTIDLGQ